MLEFQHSYFEDEAVSRRLIFDHLFCFQSPTDTAEQSLASGIDLRASCVRVAEDYTKRKHVLRVSSALPCRSEVLLQADNPVDLAYWVKALQEQVAATTDVEAKLVSTQKNACFSKQNPP